MVYELDQSFSTYIEGTVATVFDYMNYTLFCFFFIEITLKVLVFGNQFLTDFLSMFDAMVVYVSFMILILGINAKSVGILRVVRLFKIVIEMKRIADNKKRIQDLIKMHKKQGSQGIAANIERIIDLLERISKINDVPQLLKEDINWVLNVLNEGRLYQNKYNQIYFKSKRPEIKAWFKIMFNKSYSQKHLLKKQKSTIPSRKKSARNIMEKVLLDGYDINQTVFSIMDIPQHEQSLFETSTENIDQWNFDSFLFSNFGSQGFPLLTIKLFHRHLNMKDEKINFISLIEFCQEIYNGYASNSNLHGAVHLIECIHSLHYLLSIGRLRKYLSDLDVIASFIAVLFHDYEHPGLTNKFLIRTKHPLALRYNDTNVRENFHVCSGFELLEKMESPIFPVMQKEEKKEIKKIVVDSVIKSSPSYHFQLLTQLKMKLSGNFPSETYEDRKLLISLILRCIDLLKIARPKQIFLRWVELLFNELVEEGDLLKTLGLPVIKIMDRDNNSNDKFLLSFIDIIAKPFIGTFLIISSEASNKDILEEIDRNRKLIEAKVEANPTAQ